MAMPLAPTSSVEPSGADLATYSVATMAPPPGLFSMMTGWPKLSDNFCPTIRAMMSLPPPGVKPTRIWIGRDGYFDGSSWAEAEATAIVLRTIKPRYLPIRERLGLLMEFAFP